MKDVNAKMVIMSKDKSVFLANLLVLNVLLKLVVLNQTIVTGILVVSLEMALVYVNLVLTHAQLADIMILVCHIKVDNVIPVDMPVKPPDNLHSNFFRILKYRY